MGGLTATGCTFRGNVSGVNGSAIATYNNPDDQPERWGITKADRETDKDSNAERSATKPGRHGVGATTHSNKAIRNQGARQLVETPGIQITNCFLTAIPHWLAMAQFS